MTRKIAPSDAAITPDDDECRIILLRHQRPGQFGGDVPDEDLDLRMGGAIVQVLLDLPHHRRAGGIGQVQHAGEFRQHIDIEIGDRRPGGAGEPHRLQPHPGFAHLALEQHRQLRRGLDPIDLELLAIGFRRILQQLFHRAEGLTKPSRLRLAMTIVPTPGVASISPCSRRLESAWRTVKRLTSKRAHNSCSVGRREPSLCTPVSISWRSAASISR